MRHAAQFLIGAGAFLLIHGLMVLALALLPFEGFGHDPRWQADGSDIGVGGLLLIGFARVAWGRGTQSVDGEFGRDDVIGAAALETPEAVVTGFCRVSRREPDYGSLQSRHDLAEWYVVSG